MREFQNYLPEDAIEENLKENSQRARALALQEQAHLHELAEQIFHDLKERVDWLESLPDRAPAQMPEGEEEPGRRSLMLCKELSRLLERTPEYGLSSFFPHDSKNDGPLQKKLCRVAYQRNSYADAAYLLFSRHLEDPRVSYTHSFISACEDVYNGICDYCILPVESSFEGHLGSFARLIHRYELRIVATCDITGNDPERSTRYALLGKEIAPLLGKEVAADYLEFSLPLSASPSPASILAAAKNAGLSLTRINSLPGQEANEILVHLLFQLQKADLYPFLLFLFMQAPHFTPIGIYHHIEHTK